MCSLHALRVDKKMYNNDLIGLFDLIRFPNLVVIKLDVRMLLDKDMHASLHVVKELLALVVKVKDVLLPVTRGYRVVIAVQTDSEKK